MPEELSRREFLQGLVGLGAVESAEAQARKSKSTEKRAHRKTPLERQYDMAKADNLSYIQDEKQMKDFKDKGLLVELPHDKHIIYDPYLSKEGKFKINGEKHRKYKRHYCRPWVKDFLNDLAQDYSKQFPGARPLVVTSAVRPQDTQDYILDQGISNTAVAKSVHSTGATVDLAYGLVTKKTLDGRAETEKIKVNGQERIVAKIEYPGITAEEKKWLFGYLNEKERKGLLLVRTERGEPVFHFIVAKKYDEWRKKNRR